MRWNVCYEDRLDRLTLFYLGTDEAEGVLIEVCKIMRGTDRVENKKKMFPKQKPWLNHEKHSLMKTSW